MKIYAHRTWIVTNVLFILLGTPARATASYAPSSAAYFSSVSRLRDNLEYTEALKTFGSLLVLALATAPVKGPTGIDAGVDEGIFRALSDLNRLAADICGTDEDCLNEINRDVVAKTETAWEVTKQFGTEDRRAVMDRLLALSTRAASADFLRAHVARLNEATARDAAEFNLRHKAVFGGFALASLGLFIAANQLQWTAISAMALGAGGLTAVGYILLRRPMPALREVESTRNFVGPAFSSCAQDLVGA